MRNNVSVIVPSWNGLGYLRDCLTALARQSYRRHQVVLVDNGSTDGSREFVASSYPDVHIVRSERNLGFAGGTNLGIRHSRSEYVATLNNDTEPEPTWLEELVGAITSNPRLGMVASKMLFCDRRSMVNSAGIAVDRVGIAWDREGGTSDRADDTARDVFGPCAGAALYRRAMLDEIGLFDEDYFGYLEDVDLAWRGQATGWRCRYAPAARVYHVHSATGQEGSPLKNYLLGRNKWWTIVKNYPWPQIAHLAPLILAYDLMAGLYGLLARRDTHGLRGRLAAFLALPDLARKRRTIQANPDYSPHLAYTCLDSVASPMQVWHRYRHLGTAASPEVRSA